MNSSPRAKTPLYYDISSERSLYSGVSEMNPCVRRDPIDYDWASCPIDSIQYTKKGRGTFILSTEEFDKEYKKGEKKYIALHV